MIVVGVENTVHRADRFRAWTVGPWRLVVATADHAPTQDAVAILLAAHREVAPPGLDIQHLPMPEQQLHTIYPFVVLRGVRTVFVAP